jgi:hypothetical protein
MAGALNEEIIESANARLPSGRNAERWMRGLGPRSYIPSMFMSLTVRFNHHRMVNNGITRARWMFSGAPCANARMTASHERLDGKSYAIKKGARIGNRYVWPGLEDGCRCTSRAVIEGLDD